MRRGAGAGAVGGDVDGIFVISHAASTTEFRFGSVSYGTRAGFFHAAAGRVA
jgi:hypothetical protein